MNSIPVWTAALMLAFAIATGLTTGSPHGQDQAIYGSQLMTAQERNEHRARMRAATTEQEREQVRLEHHSEMQERAREMGVELPDEPPARGMGGQGTGPARAAGWALAAVRAEAGEADAAVDSGGDLAGRKKSAARFLRTAELCSSLVRVDLAQSSRGRIAA